MRHWLTCIWATRSTAGRCASTLQGETSRQPSPPPEGIRQRDRVSGEHEHVPFRSDATQRRSKGCRTGAGCWRRVRGRRRAALFFRITFITLWRVVRTNVAANIQGQKIYTTCRSSTPPCSAGRASAPPSSNQVCARAPCTHLCSHAVWPCWVCYVCSACVCVRKVRCRRGRPPTVRRDRRRPRRLRTRCSPRAAADCGGLGKIHQPHAIGVRDGDGEEVCNSCEEPAGQLLLWCPSRLLPSYHKAQGIYWHGRPSGPPPPTAAHIGHTSFMPCGEAAAAATGGRRACSSSLAATWTRCRTCATTKPR